MCIYTFIKLFARCKHAQERERTFGLCCVIKKKNCETQATIV